MVIGETDTSLEATEDPLTVGGFPFKGGVVVLSELRCCGWVSSVGEVMACTAAVDDGGFGSSCSKRQGKYVGGGEGKWEG